MITKLNAVGIKKILSRSEMKKIMGGAVDETVVDAGCIKKGELCNRNDTCCSKQVCPSQEAATCP